MADLQKENETLKEFVKTAESKTQELTGKLSAYESLGTVDEITILAGKAEESEKAVTELTAAKEGLLLSNEELTGKLSAYESLGTVEDINETSDKASELLSKYLDFGTVDELEKVESFLTRFEATGYKIEDLEKMSSEAKMTEEQRVVGALTGKYSITEELAKKTMEFTGSFEAASDYLDQLFPSAKESEEVTPPVEGSEPTEPVVVPVEGEEKKDETLGTQATIEVDPSAIETKETKKSVIADGSVSKLIK